jgi:KUP system potassium uptake protein
MTLTSAFLVLIMIMIWKTHILLIISYVLIIGSVELLYLSSVLYKFDQGGYLPLAFAAILMFVMYVWNNVYRKKYYYELERSTITNSITRFHLRSLERLFVTQVYVDCPVLQCFTLSLFKAFHQFSSIMLQMCLHYTLSLFLFQSNPCLFRRVQPKELNVFRCVVRYGYTDTHNEQEPFEKIMVERLKEFIVKEYYWSQKVIQDGKNDENLNVDEAQEVIDEERVQEEIEKEIEAVEKASRAGVVHLIGENEVIAGKGAGIGKRILIDYAYNFLKKNLRQSEKLFDIPHKRMVKVGMTYEL